MTRKAWLLSSAIAAAVGGIASPAWADSPQAAPAAAQAQSDPAPDQASASATPEAQAVEQQDNSGDIIVTAQGRAQVLSNVPVAVSVVNGDALQRSGATDIRQIAQLAPSLQVSSTGNEANGAARLRGIGTVGDNPGLESSVAVFVDGVYRSRSGVGLNELGDIERVEVLRGPQGTLFGRNASAGIISITTRAPSFDGFHGAAEASYGNYDYYRLAGNLNIPLGETLAARVDGVYVNRNGFYHDVTNNTDVNNRNRYLIRGQLAWHPSSDLSVRIIGDYTHRDEDCCAAVYANGEIEPSNTLLLSNANPIIPVLLALGQNPAAFNDPYSRNIYPTAGRSYAGTTKDWGVSGQVDYNLGHVRLTSITAYRNYSNYQGSDTDYSTVDILYRDPTRDAGARQFHTFTQELRVQGEAFGGHLDWLVGAFYGNEDLEVRDNLRFGSQYGRFATCRLAATVFGSFSAASPDCLAPATLGALRLGLVPTFGALGPVIAGGFDRLDAVRSVGSTRSVYDQNSENYAFFTHNIIHVASGLDATIGLRWTHETKRFDATFGNNNTICPTQQAALDPYIVNPAFAALGTLFQGLTQLTCLGNSSSELNGVGVNSRRSENELTGTGILSYKVTPNLLIYGSYARGYKAGGFNLDQSAFTGNSVFPLASYGGAQALTGRLQFDQEINNAFEAGFKYRNRSFSLNVAAFHQAFRNFQLNTFNGSVYLVQNINSCSDSLGGADGDLSATTGTCSSGHVRAGVISQGVEVEATMTPIRDFTVGAGFTYADTHYRHNLIGNDTGAALDPALRLLPGQQISNAPDVTVTSSVTWTPRIGNGGLSALFYMDGRLSSDYDTGSDLAPQKRQDSFFVANARIGLRGPNQRFSIELWAQNVFNAQYTQVTFNAPFQATTSNVPTTGALAGTFPAAQYPLGTQIFQSFLAEPRTYGVTLRGRF